MDTNLKLSENVVYADHQKLAITLNYEKPKVIQNENYLIHIAASLLIYSLSFCCFYLLKNKSFYLDAPNLKLFLLFISSMIISAILSRKFSHIKYYKYGTVAGKLFFSLMISLTSIVILFNFFQMQHKTPAYILGATYFGLIIETFYFLLLDTKAKRDRTFSRYRITSLRYLFLDLLILSFFCFAKIITTLYTQKNLKLENEIALIILIYISWVISAATTHKFLPLVVSDSKWNAFELQLKFYTQFIILVLLSMISLHLELSSSIIFVQAILGYTLFSAVFFLFAYAPRIENKTDEPTQKFLKDHKIQPPLIWSGGVLQKSKFSFHFTEVNELTFEKKLQYEYFKAHKDVFPVLDYMLDLNSLDLNKAIIIDSNYSQKDLLLHPESYHLFVDMNLLNNHYNVNDYLRQIRKILVPGGIFVGALLPHMYRYNRCMKKHSFWLGNIIYFFDLIWKRVFPKLPFTRMIYFKYRKEKDQAISLAEGLGRLVYTGYKIVDITTTEDAVYFAAVKDDKPTPEKKFFYSPIFKMNRIGKGGKPIYVYKLRTMYAYSEFIQDYVFRENNLQSGGKFKNDFRIPGWGKLFRKLFLDELPMLMNWIRGDLKLVGVRPISNHYMSLYTYEHSERRKNFKPGLVPPFYADLPKTIKEIEISEKRYLDSYEKNPIKTDINYLRKAVINILLKRKRSA